MGIRATRRIYTDADGWPTVRYPALPYREAHHVMRLLHRIELMIPGVTEDTTAEDDAWAEGFSDALTEVAIALCKATRGRQTYYKREQIMKGVERE